MRRRNLIGLRLFNQPERRDGISIAQHSSPRRWTVTRNFISELVAMFVGAGAGA
jgi:hypothetical protein